MIFLFQRGTAIGMGQLEETQNPTPHNIFPRISLVLMKFHFQEEFHGSVLELFGDSLDLLKNFMGCLRKFLEFRRDFMDLKRNSMDSLRVLLKSKGNRRILSKRRSHIAIFWNEQATLAASWTITSQPTHPDELNDISVPKRDSYWDGPTWRNTKSNSP